MRDERIQQAEHLKPRVVLPVLLLAAAIGLLVLGIMSVSAAPAQQTATEHPLLLYYKSGEIFNLLDSQTGGGIEFRSDLVRDTGTNLSSWPAVVMTYGEDDILYGFFREYRTSNSRNYWYTTLTTLDLSNGVVTTHTANRYSSGSSNSASSNANPYATFFYDNSLYVVRSSSSSYLHTVNTTTGEFSSSICRITGHSGTFRQVTNVGGRLFGNVGPDIYEVNISDTSNCTATIVGSTSVNLGSDFSSLYGMVGVKGTLYGIALQALAPRDYKLVTIDTSTGEASSVNTAATYVEDEALTRTGRLALMLPDYFISTSGMAACQNLHAQDQGTFENSSADMSGSFRTDSCLVDSDGNTSAEDNYIGDDDKTPARVFSFQMKSGRTVDINFNPSTAFVNNYVGQYAVKIRTGSATGNVVSRSEGKGRESFVVQSISLGGSTTYYLEVSRYGVGGGAAFSVTLTYNYIQSPTPTVLPTATPAPVPNLDTRIDPEPNSRRYEDQKVYQFTVAGNDDFFPVTIRAGNAAAVKLSTTVSTLNCALTSSELRNVAEGITFYAHICKGGTNSTLRVLRKSSNTETALYAMVITGRIFTVGGGTPTPGPPSNPKAVYGFGQRPDAIGITLFTKEVCGAAGMSCNVNMIKDAFGLVGAAVVFLIVVVAGKGQSTFSYGLGFALATVALMLGYLLIGLPLWYALTAILIITAATSLGVVVKVRRAV